MPWPDIGIAVQANNPCKDLPIDYSVINDNREWWLSVWLPTIGARRTALLQSRCWIENDEDGFTGWRWDKYSKTRWLVSAANRYHDIVIVAPRHGSVDIHQGYTSMGGWEMLLEYAHRNGVEEEQGFIDQYSIFYGRAEALEMAKANDQVRYPDGNTERELFSEGLY